MNSKQRFLGGAAALAIGLLASAPAHAFKSGTLPAGNGFAGCSYAYGGTVCNSSVQTADACFIQLNSGFPAGDIRLDTTTCSSSAARWWMPLPIDSTTAVTTVSATVNYSIGTGVTARVGYLSYYNNGTLAGSSESTVSSSLPQYKTWTTIPKPNGGYALLYMDTATFYAGVSGYSFEYDH